jgi:hypothetical protein
MYIVRPSLVRIGSKSVGQLTRMILGVNFEMADHMDTSTVGPKQTMQSRRRVVCIVGRQLIGNLAKCWRLWIKWPTSTSNTVKPLYLARGVLTLGRKPKNCDALWVSLHPLRPILNWVKIARPTRALGFLGFSEAFDNG